MNTSIILSNFLVFLCIPNNKELLFYNISFVFGINLIFYLTEPNQIKILINENDYKLIFLNILITLFTVYLFLEYVENNIYNDLSFNFKEFTYILLWIISDEILFFFCHKTLHNKYIYKYIHKYHHKYKITNSLTSFYAHPIDQTIVNICFLFVPFIMLYYSNIKISIFCIYFFILEASITFINSHHTIKDNENLDNLIHHKKINYNYGNFYLLDKLYGTRI